MKYVYLRTRIPLCNLPIPVSVFFYGIKVFQSEQSFSFSTVCNRPIPAWGFLYGIYSSLNYQLIVFQSHQSYMEQSFYSLGNPLWNIPISVLVFIQGLDLFQCQQLIYSIIDIFQS